MFQFTFVLSFARQKYAEIVHLDSRVLHNFIFHLNCFVMSDSEKGRHKLLKIPSNFTEPLNIVIF